MTPAPPDLIEKMLVELAVYSNRRQGMKAAARVMLEAMREWNTVPPEADYHIQDDSAVMAYKLDDFAKENGLD